MRFTKLQDIPSEYRALINLLIEKGIIVVTNDEFEYPLSLDQLYLIRIIPYLVDLKRLELSTSRMRTERSPEWFRYMHPKFLKKCRENKNIEKT